MLSKFLNFFTGYGVVSAGPCITDIPNCCNDIEGRDDRTHWLKAIREELDSMETNRVRKLQRCPLQSKWAFRVKQDGNGKEVSYKARSVVKEYLQRQSIDYDAPRFLHGGLKEDIYMVEPDGVEADQGMVCMLKKSLYGLK